MGVFIAIEGGDGSGKATQAARLARRLAVSHQVLQVSFPNYGTPSAKFIEAYLNGEYGSAPDIAPQLAAPLYAIDRFALRDEMREAITRPDAVVITDRYVASNLAYQGAKIADASARHTFYDDLRRLEYDILGLPKPDCSVLLLVPPSTSQQHMKQRGPRAYTTKFHDEHEKDSDYLTRANTGYEELVKRYPNEFSRVSCMERSGVMRSIDTIADDVWNVVAPLIQHRS